VLFVKTALRPLQSRTEPPKPPGLQIPLQQRRDCSAASASKVKQRDWCAEAAREETCQRKQAGAANSR